MKKNMILDVTYNWLNVPTSITNGIKNNKHYLGFFVQLLSLSSMARTNLNLATAICRYPMVYGFYQTTSFSLKDY